MKMRAFFGEGTVHPNPIVLNRKSLLVGFLVTLVAVVGAAVLLFG